MSLQRWAVKPFLNQAYRWDFPDIIKFCVAAHTISEKAIWFRHPDYNHDRAQKLISSSMSRHLSTRNVSSKSMHAFLGNLAYRQTERQTDKRTRAKTYTSSLTASPPPAGYIRRLQIFLTPHYGNIRRPAYCLHSSLALVPLIFYVQRIQT